MANSSLRPSPLFLPLQSLISALNRTARQIEGGHPEAMDSLLDAFIALDALPLPTNDYAWAASRLKNAGKYLTEGEQGAARYEVLALQRRLPKLTPGLMNTREFRKGG